ncbi:hypothetical protein Q3C01_35540 [Bradyrhizobium sp. UFLA05-109]
MPGNAYVNHAHVLASEIAEQNAVLREIVAQALDVLRVSPPDTFLGRKTQERFPAADPSKG